MTLYLLVALAFAIAAVLLTISAMRFFKWLSATSTKLTQSFERLIKIVLKVCVVILVLGVIVAAIFLLKGCYDIR